MLQACSIASFAEITTCTDILPYMYAPANLRPPVCAYGFGKHAVALTPELGMQISKVRVFLKGS